MAATPPVKLGAILFVPFAGAFSVRGFLVRRSVDVAPVETQPKRQFFLDLLLNSTAGAAAAAYLVGFLEFPASSGIKLFIGCVVAGFFMSMDMSLFRERLLILSAKASDEVKPPDRRLFSMTRKFSLVAVLTTIFVSVILSLVIARDIAWLSTIHEHAISLQSAQMSVIYEILFVMGALFALVLNLILSYSKNLKLLFENETGVLERVSRGDLSRMVPVATNDEFGLIAGHTNDMILGLRHRSRLLASLKVAEEVQQNLLPARPPEIDGLDVAGMSIYCDETGGDYYDYFPLSDGRLGVVVADASDHGVGSALYMTTARAFLRFGVDNYEDPATLVAVVNRFLAMDSRESGRFMTLMFMEIDPVRKRLDWVRAGHDPSLLFDPATGEFTEMGGAGIALGVSVDSQYSGNSMEGWTDGAILLVGTDGIWEARNRDGEMFGKERLAKTVREWAGHTADALLCRIVEALNVFCEGAPRDDDVTLVVVKLSA